VISSQQALLCTYRFIASDKIAPLILGCIGQSFEVVMTRSQIINDTVMMGAASQRLAWNLMGPISYCWLGL